MTGRPDGQLPQLLPSVANAQLNRALADSLRALRKHIPQTDLRERIDDVLAGRACLRDLARDESFTTAVTPLADKGWQHWQEMTDEDRDKASADAHHYFEQDD